ncbi:MAG TPA: hypothetical protein VIN35_08325 [Hydrogenophaga sp.]
MPIHPDSHPGAALTDRSTTPSVELSLGLVADVQDALMMAMTDLKRLEGLLDHATGNLLERFGSANHALAQLVDSDSAALQNIRHNLHQAVTELQFHDMATQLIGHTGKVLQGCAWKLADSAMAPEEDEIPLEVEMIPERPSPVTQSEMDAGSIDLF